MTKSKAGAFKNRVDRARQQGDIDAGKVGRWVWVSPEREKKRATKGAALALLAAGAAATSLGGRNQAPARRASAAGTTGTALVPLTPLVPRARAAAPGTTLPPLMQAMPLALRARYGGSLSTGQLARLIENERGSSGPDREWTFDEKPAAVRTRTAKPKKAHRPARRRPPTCASEHRRIQELERIVASLKQGRATAIRRATAPRPDNFRTANMFAAGPLGQPWNEHGPAWASLKYAREIAVRNRGAAPATRAGTAARFVPPPLPTRRRLGSA
jgi:hypothetical protein